VCYRGVGITQDDLRIYRWSLKYDSVIATETFCSTSSDQSVAEMFAQATSLDKMSVLLIFTFPERCDTAIDLGKQPSISEFGDEAEVLIGPNSLFTVARIEIAGTYIIYLVNIAVNPSSLLSAVRWIVS
jgi:hypothetical protein